MDETMELPKSELDLAIRKVLSAAAKGKGQSPQFLTAYQVFERLPQKYKDQVIAKYNKVGGADSGVFFSACSYIAQLLSLMEDVSRFYLDTQGIQFWVEGKYREAGYQVCAVYSLR